MKIICFCSLLSQLFSLSVCVDDYNSSTSAQKINCQNKCFLFHKVPVILKHNDNVTLLRIVFLTRKLRWFAVANNQMARSYCWSNQQEQEQHAPPPSGWWSNWLVEVWSFWLGVTGQQGGAAGLTGHQTFLLREQRKTGEVIFFFHMYVKRRGDAWFFRSLSFSISLKPNF